MSMSYVGAMKGGISEQRNAKKLVLSVLLDSAYHRVDWVVWDDCSRRRHPLADASIVKPSAGDRPANTTFPGG